MSLRDRLRLRRARRTDDVQAELAFHRDMVVRELIAGGMTREAAAQEAIRRLPSTPAAETRLVRLAASRDRRLRAFEILEELRADALDAFRRLRRSPGFTLGAIAMVALGIGANSAVFSVANTIYFRSLPFGEASRIIRVQEYQRSQATGIMQWYDTSAVTLDAARDNPAVAVASGLWSIGAQLLTGGDAEHLEVGLVTSHWGDVMGVAPAIGRLFTPAEEASGVNAGVAVISYRLWQSHFSGRHDVLGQSLTFDDGTRVIVGVLPAGINFPYEEDVWWPVIARPDQRGLFTWARLRPGATLAQANAAFDAVGPSLRRDHPQVLRGLLPRARDLRTIIIGDEDRIVLLLTWAVAVLLLIVGSNVAMLFVTRITSRQTELALRTALGCGRGRQIRHLVLECIMVFMAGGAAGLALAWSLTGPMRALIPSNLSGETGLASAGIDLRVVLFTVVIAAMSGLVFGVIAAIRADRSDLISTLRQSSRGGGSTSGRRTLGALVVLELTLASALLCAAFSLGSAFRALEDRDVGFRTDQLLTFHIALESDRLTKPGVRVDLLSRLQTKMQSLPGVTGVGMATVNPLCCGDWGANLEVDGATVPFAQAPMIAHNLVWPGFFETLGMHLEAGRVFDAHDTLGSEPVVIVDNRLAREYFPKGDALGRRIRRATRDNSSPWLRIVGITAPIEDRGEYGAGWFLPYLQYPNGASSNEVHVWMRTRDLGQVAPAVRAAVADVDRTVPAIDLRSMDEIRHTDLGHQRVGAIVAVMLASGGALLALCGVYGLVAFVVAREQREMGIRMALGAVPWSMCGSIIARMLRLGVAGTIAGLLIARLAQSALLAALGADTMAIRAIRTSFWLEATIVSALLLTAVALAAFVPARRILRIDPVRALTA